MQIFMVDSSDDLSYQAVAKYVAPCSCSCSVFPCPGSFLHSILVSERVARRRVPVLIACNKSDLDSARSANYVRAQLEQHL